MINKQNQTCNQLHGYLPHPTILCNFPSLNALISLTYHKNLNPPSSIKEVPTDAHLGVPLDKLPKLFQPSDDPRVLSSLKDGVQSRINTDSNFLLISHLPYSSASSPHLRSFILPTFFTFGTRSALRRILGLQIP
jgi:hypothetical protein